MHHLKPYLVWTLFGQNEIWMGGSARWLLNPRRTKKDGTESIRIRITINRKLIEWSIGYSVSPKYWDEQKQMVVSGCPQIDNVTRFNHYLTKTKSQIMGRILELEESGELQRLSLAEIKQKLRGQYKELGLLFYASAVIEQLKESGKHGNARVYDTLLRSVRNFQKNKEVPLRQINFRWLKRYEAWYLGRGNTVNGLAVNLRTLRALINRAIKEKRLAKEYYPFEDYKIRSQKTRKRAITLEEFHRVKEYAPVTERERKAKIYFLTSFYLMGASFVDIAFLQRKNLMGQRVEYTRRKTGQLFSIPLSPPLEALLTPYLQQPESEEAFIFPIITAVEEDKQLIQMRDELRRYNRSLKAIGKACEITGVLTSYVARHSYATIAKYKGVPTAVISEALGHSSEEVTQIYLNAFDRKVMDEYHKQIIG